MMDLKGLILETTNVSNLARVRNSMHRAARETAPMATILYSIAADTKGLVFVDNRIVFPFLLRRPKFDISPFGHSGTAKMTAEAKTSLLPEMKKIATKVKDCTACRIREKHNGE